MPFLLQGNIKKKWRYKLKRNARATIYEVPREDAPPLYLIDIKIKNTAWSLYRYCQSKEAALKAIRQAKQLFDLGGIKITNARHPRQGYLVKKKTAVHLTVF